ncbi:MAG TPA: NAD(P)/FAD-dependent oxidoreductase [Povalibacter sp.]|uniref:NAD(P)/FAD-dependent oxidoreductase n=1 Tax=Povalibacter sp. TaxID=1962978 RepID=UPI002CB952E4|nr:NAD(P)/FAD-dependent oxidoreductase [Povalibacter sp.]HMN46135.1 NAD(P)/FAD-dependent oxidoreductase [Povalibacter sp.]
MKRIVVVGAGFAGLNAARRMRRLKEVDITVIDRENHHLFQPLLYQVAMAALSPAEIAAPIRSLLSRGNARVIKASAERIDIAGRVVVTDCGEFPYDYLLLACGAQHAYFGREDWEPHAPGLKNLPQATEIRRRVLEAFEAAERENDIALRRQHLTFVVVGGGPTGVELAGAIGEMSRYTLARDFRTIDPRQTRVILVEAGPRILPSFAPKLAARAMRDLESLGVQVWTSARVTNVTAQGVTIGNEQVAASTVLWAAGVRAADIGRTLGTAVDPVGRVVVKDDLTLPEHPEVFVAGDLAHCNGEDGKPLPGVALVAMQQGIYAADMIRNDLRGKPRTPFRYRNLGQLATIGRSRAICEIFGMKLSGWLAWWVWLLVHIYRLSGFRNRIIVLVQWAWSYMTFTRGARLIVGKEWQAYAPHEPRQ